MAGVVPEDVAGELVVTASLAIPPDELQWRFSRSSGPGGQSVNTTDSRVELGWDAAGSEVITSAQRTRLLARIPVGVVWVTAAEHRSQWQNRREARRKLAAAVRAAIAKPPPSRRATRPSRASVQRRLAAKHRRGELKRQRRNRDD